MDLAHPRSPHLLAGARAHPSLLLALLLAFLGGCPVILNLLGTYVADGNSFLITAGGTFLALALTLAAGVHLGLPLADLRGLHGPTLALSLVGACFWAQWLMLNIISPSPVEQMSNLTIQSVLWNSIPLTLFVLWRRWIDTAQVVRMLVALLALYVAGLTVRYALGLGHYHSGRWHAGDSLEAIRSGHYAGLALWVFALACCSPARLVPPALKAVALIGIPLAVFMAVATNSRGPTLSLAVTILATAVPLARLLGGLIGRDARLLLALLVVAAASGAFVISQLGTVESDFGRMVTLTNDGGSAESRVTLWHDHLQLIAQNPLGLITGFGYDHGLFYPHNVMIEALVAGGVPSLLLLLAMVAIGLRAWLAPCMRDDIIGLICAGIFIFDLVGYQVSGSIATDTTWYGALLLVLRHEELSGAAQRAA